MATFTWTPDIGSDCEREPKIRSVNFGESYSQEAPAGLNPDMRTRNLSFTGRSVAEITAIDTFLGTQGGVTSFDYTHPRDISRKYKCKTWKLTDTGYGLSLTAVFKQVPI